MNISLVIATLGRPAELRRLFDSLARQAFKNFDVVIVDQSDSQTSEVVRNLVDEFSVFFQIYYVHSPERGLSKARNIGLRHVCGQIVGFPDDDCWYAEGFLAKVVALFSSDPQLVYVCGQYTEPGVVNTAFSQKRKLLRRFSDARFGSSVTLFVSTERQGRAHISFDEQLGAGAAYPAGEETDLMSRLLLIGCHGVYEPELCAYHLIVRGEQSTAVRLSRDRAYGYWLGKHRSNLQAATLFLLGIAKLLVSSLGRKSSRSRIVERCRGFVAASKH